MTIRSAYKLGKAHPGVTTTQPSMTRQSEMEACDINGIMRKFEKTGLVDHVNTYRGDYAEFTEAPDYHTAMNVVAQANEMFMSLPAKIRAGFNNDPGAFLAFVDDPANEDQARAMGLLPPAEPTPAEEAGKTAEPDPKPPAAKAGGAEAPQAKPESAKEG